MSLDCQGYQDELLQQTLRCCHWVDLELSSELRLHLRGCQECRTRVRQQLELETSLGEMASLPLPGFDLRAAVMSRISEQPASLPAWLPFAPLLLLLGSFLPTPTGLPTWAWPHWSWSWPQLPWGVEPGWADAALTLSVILLVLSTYRWRRLTFASR